MGNQISSSEIQLTGKCERSSTPSKRAATSSISLITVAIAIVIVAIAIAIVIIIIIIIVTATAAAIAIVVVTIATSAIPRVFSYFAYRGKRGGCDWLTGGRKNSGKLGNVCASTILDWISGVLCDESYFSILGFQSAGWRYLG